MYQIGDLILYGRTGVCRVEDILEKQPQDAAGTQKYYVLQPLYQKCCITIPADSEKIFIRPIITKQQAQQLIRTIPSIPAEPYYNRNLNQLREHYRLWIESHSCEDLIAMAKSLRLKRSEAEAQKKKFGAVDERFLKEAEDLLYGELAAALEIERAEVGNYIAKTLQSV